MNHKDQINFTIPYKTRLALYKIWIERGWWTPSEATCVFLKYNPCNADDYEFYSKITSGRLSEHISLLVAEATTKRSVQIVIDKGPNRASCYEWIQWAKTYPIIQLDPDLVGLIVKSNKKHIKNSAKQELLQIKITQFRTLARVALSLCPKACLEEIITISEQFGIDENLPSTRTLRNWLKPDITLSKIKRTDEEVALIKTKLTPIAQ